MKRLLIVVLLCILAMATIFATMSCKGKLVSGGKNIPPSEPGHYLYDGGKWNKIPVDNFITGWGGQFELDQFNQGTTFTVRAGKPIKYAYRMTPTEKQSAGGLFSNVSEITVSHIGISPLCDAQDNKPALEFISSGQMHGNDKSDYTAGYVMLEYDELPPSPISKYWMHILVAPGYGIGIIVQ